MSAFAFADIKTAPTTVHLPACPNGCGEMLLTGDGYMCPICSRFMSYPARRRS